MLFKFRKLLAKLELFNERKYRHLGITPPFYTYINNSNYCFIILRFDFDTLCRVDWCIY